MKVEWGKFLPEIQGFKFFGLLGIQSLSTNAKFQPIRPKKDGDMGCVYTIIVKLPDSTIKLSSAK